MQPVGLRSSRGEAGKKDGCADADACMRGRETTSSYIAHYLCQCRCLHAREGNHEYIVRDGNHEYIVQEGNHGYIAREGNHEYIYIAHYL